MGSVTLLASPAQAAAVAGVTITNVSANEAGELVFQVTIAADAGPLDLEYATFATGASPATAGTDYTAIERASLLEIGADPTDEQIMQITVQGKTDTLDEANETFALRIFESDEPATPVDFSEGIGTLIDDDAAPSFTLTASPNPVGEAAGVTVVTATLAAVSGRDVTIPIDTANVTATAGDDYTAIAAGSISITAGLRTGSVPVSVADDTIDEVNETFTVTGNLGGADPDVTGTKIATVTITDDDATPTVSIEAPTDAVTEGSNLVFPVTLSAESGRVVTVTVNTVDGTATAPADYTAREDTLVTFAAGSLVPTDPGGGFPAGVSAAGITVPTVDDDVNEADTENFSVALSSPVGVALGTSTATGVINDEAGGLPGFSVGDVAVSESGDKATLTVTLTEAAEADASLEITGFTGDSTADIEGAGGTDPGDDDFPALVDIETEDKTVTIPAGQLTGTLSVPINDDGVHEPAETIVATVDLAAGEDAIAGSAVEATVTINDDDEYFIAINSASAAEGTAAQISADVIGVSQDNVTLDFTVARGSVGGSNAADAADYTIASPTFRTTIPTTTESGDTVVIRAFPVNNDTISEPSETIVVTATGSTGVTVNQGVITITDTDAAPSLTIGDRWVNEEADVVSVPVRLTYSGDTTSTEGGVTVAYSTANGTARAGSDYTASSDTLTFGGRKTYLPVYVRIINDRAAEGAEAFTVRLGTVTPSRVTKADGTATVTIRANDGARSAQAGPSAESADAAAQSEDAGEESSERPSAEDVNSEDVNSEATDTEAVDAEAMGSEASVKEDATEAGDAGSDDAGNEAGEDETSTE